MKVLPTSLLLTAALGAVLAAPASQGADRITGPSFAMRSEVIAPEASPLALLELVQWPGGRSPVVVVGHQPTLGQVIARLLGLTEDDCAVKKGALWWLRHRERAGVSRTVVVTVQTPELT